MESLYTSLLPIETWNTVYMVFVAGLLAHLFGIPLAILLTLTGKGQPLERRWLYSVLSTLVNIGRSFPFVILMVALIPLTRFIAGTSLGTTAAIIPLTVAAIPFVARLTEGALREMDKALIEAALVMGSTPWQLVYKVLIPEAFPSLILNATTTLVTLVGYSAMAGTIGGGGLGKLAIQYGYQRFNPGVIVATVFILILLVQAIQWTGNKIAHRICKKRGKVVS